MTGFFKWRDPMLSDRSGKPLLPVNLPDVIDRTILANQRVARASVFRPLEGVFLPVRGYRDRCGAERDRTGKARSEAAAHVGFKGDLALETEALREGGQFHEHGSRAACVERAGSRHFPCFEKMTKKFRCSSTKPKTSVVRVKMQRPEAQEFFLVKNAIFESGAHENVETRFRSLGPHRFSDCAERGDSNPSCRQHHIGSSLDPESVAQRADEIQGFSPVSRREPFGSSPDDPVKDLEAGDAAVLREAMHAEGTSQQGVRLPVAANVVKLAWDRGMVILRAIESQTVTILCNALVS
jgi:hypothetical protein